MVVETASLQTQDQHMLQAPVVNLVSQPVLKQQQTMATVTQHQIISIAGMVVVRAPEHANALAPVHTRDVTAMIQTLPLCQPIRCWLPKRRACPRQNLNHCYKCQRNFFLWRRLLPAHRRVKPNCLPSKCLRHCHW